MSDKCLDCGLSENEHHTFVSGKVPEGCCCDPLEWRDPANVPPVCKAFDVVSPGATPQTVVKIDGDGLCFTCQHPSECHRKNEEAK